jgi:transposase InsO family protein
VVRARQRRCSSLTIARELRLPLSTVVQLQRRLGYRRLPPLQPVAPVVRYEWRQPGALVHVDVKKLAAFAAVGHRIHGDRTRRGRALGWRYVHVAIDDATRLAYAEVLPSERREAVQGFLARAWRWYRRRGIRIRRLMTDNAKAYTSQLVQAFLQQVRCRHVRTRPYRPQTNGKAERFIRTLLSEWAYRQAYPTSEHQAAALGPYLTYYNTQRPHGGLAMLTPAQRLQDRR